MSFLWFRCCRKNYIRSAIADGRVNRFSAAAVCVDGGKPTPIPYKYLTRATSRKRLRSVDRGDKEAIENMHPPGIGKWSTGSSQANFRMRSCVRTAHKLNSNTYKASKRGDRHQTPKSRNTGVAKHNLRFRQAEEAQQTTLTCRATTTGSIGASQEKAPRRAELRT